MTDRIARQNLALEAYTDIPADRALRAAGAIDATMAAGGDPGPFACVLQGVNSPYDVAVPPTQAGLLIRRDVAPAAIDPTFVVRMAGAVSPATQTWISVPTASKGLALGLRWAKVSTLASQCCSSNGSVGRPRRVF